MNFPHVLLVLLCALPASFINSQIIIKGSVKGVNNTPISWCSIGIQGKNVGTYSMEDGKFALEISASHFDDTLKFSHVGLETLEMPIRQFLKSNENVVVLKESISRLDEVVVHPLLTDDYPRIGNYAKRSASDISIVYPHRGAEVGLIVASDNCPFFIDRVFVKFRLQNLTQVRLRMRIYKMEKSSPDSIWVEKISEGTYQKQVGEMCFQLDGSIKVNNLVFISFQWLVDEKMIARIEEANGYSQKLINDYVSNLCEGCNATIYNQKTISIRTANGQPIESHKLSKSDSRRLNELEAKTSKISFLTTKTSGVTLYRSHSLGKWHRYDQNLVAWLNK